MGFLWWVTEEEGLQRAGVESVHLLFIRCACFGAISGLWCFVSEMFLKWGGEICSVAAGTLGEADIRSDECKAAPPMTEPLLLQQATIAAGIVVGELAPTRLACRMVLRIGPA